MSNLIQRKQDIELLNDELKIKSEELKSLNETIDKIKKEDERRNVNTYNDYLSTKEKKELENKILSERKAKLLTEIEDLGVEKKVSIKEIEKNNVLNSNLKGENEFYSKDNVYKESINIEIENKNVNLTKENKEKEILLNQLTEKEKKFIKELELKELEVKDIDRKINILKNEHLKKEELKLKEVKRERFSIARMREHVNQQEIYVREQFEIAGVHYTPYEEISS